MWVIGVTGGVASGKSFVAQHLGQRGAAVLNADHLGHAVLRLPGVKSSLRARWGDGVFSGPDRVAVDRAAVAERVFAREPDGPRELAYLEELTHPLIGALMARRLQRWRQGGSVAAAVLDAPVLYKAGWDRFCDRILYVDAPWEVRRTRATQRGWTAEQLEARQSMQPSLAGQRARADVVIDNGGSLPDTVRQIDEFWDALLAIHKKSDGHNEI